MTAPRVTYPGHATVLLEIGGACLLTDPNLDARYHDAIDRLRGHLGACPRADRVRVVEPGASLDRRTGAAARPRDARLVS